MPSRVLLGEPDDSLLLGWITVEGMGLAFDAMKRLLVAKEIFMLARVGGSL